MLNNKSVLIACLLSCAFAISCNSIAVQQNDPPTYAQHIESKMYSKNVMDSFTISINLPTQYRTEHSYKYPVVYLLDANMYFDILATTLNKYSEVGLAPPLILVGVGYKDLQAMDSLRNRDYTYPTAIPD